MDINLLKNLFLGSVGFGIYDRNFDTVKKMMPYSKTAPNFSDTEKESFQDTLPLIFDPKSQNFYTENNNTNEYYNDTSTQLLPKHITFLKVILSGLHLLRLYRKIKIYTVIW